MIDIVHVFRGNLFLEFSNLLNKENDKSSNDSYDFGSVNQNGLKSVLCESNVTVSVTYSVIF